jgi:4-amino-4-deoxy-L-arabinose transferase-like glycosyltransferase
MRGNRDIRDSNGGTESSQSGLLTYLQENTTDIKYLVAVNNAMTGAPYVLATGRPVLYMGGFSGSDNVVDADGLAELVANGELRYVLEGGGGGGGGNSDISTWLEENCSVVDTSQYSSGETSRGMGGMGGGGTLYQCGN